MRRCTSYAFSIDTPSKVIVKVFAPMKCQLTGYLRLDCGTMRCADPWRSVVRYIDHMQRRGWATIDMVTRVPYGGDFMIVVAMEKL